MIRTAIIFAVVGSVAGVVVNQGSASKPLLTAKIRNAAIGVRPDAHEGRLGRTADPSDSDPGREAKVGSLRDVPETSRPVLFVFEANVSAYCPCELCCGTYSDGITASGHVIQPGDKFVAAPANIPFGTMIDIPGYGCVPVLDRGGAIKGNKLDVFFALHSDAIKFGRQYLVATIKGE